ncbi:MAG: hypothetical protein IPL40_00655 [Proteobacteria bacterium]|nr:hypothetical protein [Pseudomonadota bacterium]
MPIPMVAAVAIGTWNAVRALSLLKGVAHAAKINYALRVVAGAEGFAGARTLQLTIHEVNHSLKVTRAGQVTLACLDGAVATERAVSAASTLLRYGKGFASLYPETATAGAAAPTMMGAGQVIHRGVGVAAKVVK